MEEEGVEAGLCGGEVDELGAGLDAHMIPDASKPMRAVNAVAPVGVMLFGMVGGIIGSGTSFYYESHSDGLAAPPPLWWIFSHMPRLQRCVCVCVYRRSLACAARMASFLHRPFISGDSPGYYQQSISPGFRLFP